MDGTYRGLAGDDSCAGDGVDIVDKRCRWEWGECKGAWPAGEYGFLSPQPNDLVQPDVGYGGGCIELGQLLRDAGLFA